jgi:nucleotide-binding universal stress UspA family protein
MVILSLSHPPAPQPMARLDSGLSTIIRRCPRPVMLVPRTASPLERGLLAYDGSPKAEEALFVATYLSNRWDMGLVVVTVMEAGLTSSETLARAQQYLESHGVQATFVEERGPAAGAIMITAEERACDLIIMGGYGSSPMLEVVLGSTVDQVLRTSGRPMLICR